MNNREIFFLCENTADYICSEYPSDRYCKHCRRLEKYNSLFEKITQKKQVILESQKNHVLKLLNLVNDAVDHVLKYKKYYVLPDLKDKQCDINH